LLDVGLPKLNGLDAARQIRKLVPETKILFLTQESSADVAQEALRLGAQGYVVKAYAGSELLAAVQAVLQGNQYVSSGLPGHDFTDATDAKIRDRIYYNESIATPGPGEKEITGNHEVQFYSDDASLLVGFASFIEAGLKAGNTVIVVATESHRETLLRRLQAQSVDNATAIEQGRYVSLDTEEMLSTFMVNDLPDPVRFFKIVGDLIMAAGKAAKGNFSHVSACAECAPALCAQGKADAAIQLEHFCNELVKTHGMDILCGYVLEGFEYKPKSLIYERICAEHTTVRSQ
jgi:hypothetical protein